jgi:hypothetical protein
MSVRENIGGKEDEEDEGDAFIKPASFRQVPNFRHIKLKTRP